MSLSINVELPLVVDKEKVLLTSSELGQLCNLDTTMSWCRMISLAEKLGKAPLLWQTLSTTTKSLSELRTLTQTILSEYPDDGSEKCEERVRAFEFAREAALRMSAKAEEKVAQ